MTLAVATCRRPEGLARLLDGIAALTPVPGWEVSVLVVDNSPEGGAVEMVRRRAGSMPFPLRVRHATPRGLARARNAALEAALDDGCAWLGFIDDDEVPCRSWLSAHVATLAETGAEASMGAVHAAFERPPPRWVREGGFLEMRGARHARMAHGATSNILFSLAPVRAAGLRFDPACDLTGGEDTAFFDAYMRLGGRIVFCPEARVRETIPAARARLGWLWRRWRRTGQSSARVRMARTGERASCLLGGAARLLAGAALAGAGLVAWPLGRPAPWARGLRVAARGLGFIDAALGRRTLEYAEPAR